ncbi:hypothetical protein HCN51_43915 [Nonomuraea sp. FMUSA5-5]|uniref:Peptidase M50 domain-containing protein n=1 Tax=Nonomuraea composti TaxID=2720023 RepID=A0ABX1BM25_9ACTN|nr:hypothetical protein [Nonomuraea sp. FMUSA5-5]NJP96306.1 hypothetical protein [Nonomuraea sp. FMUSA5-5]
MKASVRLGRLFGIPIAANRSALLVLALIALIIADGVLPAAAPGHARALYWVTGVAAALVFLACLPAHELAHSVLARRHGVRVKSITLWMLGGPSQRPTSTATGTKRHRHPSRATTARGRRAGRAVAGGEP